jgi:hypothetical protein
MGPKEYSTKTLAERIRLLVEATTECITALKDGAVESYAPECGRPLAIAALSSKNFPAKKGAGASRSTKRRSRSS